MDSADVSRRAFMKLTAATGASLAIPPWHRLPLLPATRCSAFRLERFLFPNEPAGESKRDDLAES